MHFLLDLNKLSTTQKYAKNTVIISENANAPYSMYVILKGEVNVYKNYGQDNSFMINTLGPGDFFGEMSLYLMQQRTATVVAAIETTVIELDQPSAHKFLRDHPDFTHNMIKTLCSRIVDLNQRVSMKFNRL